MKLQNLSVIFIIIIIPVILVVSYYIGLQIDTINLQTSYDTKLQESAKEAISALEINTVEWNSNYSMLADSKRRDVRASANTFLNSLANKMGIGGTSKEYMLNYVPALAYTLYDGYYIYANTQTSKVETFSGTGTVVLGEDGQPISEEKKYDHMLQSFTPYSETLTTAMGDVVTINYTLDNYVKVYYKPSSGDYVTYEGYLTDPNDIEITTPATVNFNDKDIKEEILSEQIYYKNSTSYESGTFTYVYDSNNVKTYYDPTKDDFFQLDSDKKRNYLNNISTAKYKKIVEVDTENKPITYYQALCNGAGITKGEVFIKETSEYTKIDETVYSVSNIEKDYSARNYYIESAAFTKWFNKNIENKSWTSNIDSLNINTDTFKISSINNPDPESKKYSSSLFTIHKREVIKNSIEKNLKRVVDDASNQLTGATYEFRLPVLSETDWDQLLDNVSIIAFLQGVPTGLKTYNNYAIATSNNNKEYVDPDRIFLSVDGDQYYHKRGCTHIVNTASNAIGYRSIDYILKTQKTSDTETKYYYLHDKYESGNTNSELGCYYCIVDSSKINTVTTEDIKFDKEYYTALARERFVQSQGVIPKIVITTITPSGGRWRRGDYCATFRRN